MTPEVHEYTFIFLCGLTGHASRYYEKRFKDGKFAPANCKIVIGHGPERENRKYPGKIVNSWYDMDPQFTYEKALTQQDMTKRHNTEEMNESAEKLLKIIEEEKMLLPN